MVRPNGSIIIDSCLRPGYGAPRGCRPSRGPRPPRGRWEGGAGDEARVPRGAHGRGEARARRAGGALRPRRWRGALLPGSTRFVLENLNPGKRPVSAVADFTEVRDVARVEIWEDRGLSFHVLFD